MFNINVVSRLLSKLNNNEIQILTFVKFGTYKWVLIASLLDIAVYCDVATLELLSDSIVSIESNTGTSLKLGGFSMVKPKIQTANKKSKKKKNNIYVNDMKWKS